MSDVLLADITKHDITSENWRKYIYPKGEIYLISCPKTLYLKRKESGDSHRVVDGTGVTHYPAPGWIAIQWKADPEVTF